MSYYVYGCASLSGQNRRNSKFYHLSKSNGSRSSGEPLDDSDFDINYAPSAPSSSDSEDDYGTNGKSYITCSIAVIVMSFFHCKYVISM